MPSLRLDVPKGQHMRMITTPFGRIILAEGKYSTFAVLDNPQMIEWAKNNLSAICVMSEIE